MTHYGIICPSSTGHLNPMTTLGYELKRRGHRVTVLGIEDTRKQVLAAGLELFIIGHSSFPKGRRKELSLKLGELSPFKMLQFAVNWAVNYNSVLCHDTPEAIKAVAIEALLVDQVSPAGGTVAEYLGIPFVSICSAMMQNQEISVPPSTISWNYDTSWRGLLRNRLGYALVNRIGKSLLKVINNYRREWNLSSYIYVNESFSKLAQISQQPAEFEFPRKELPSYFHFTGPYNNPSSRVSTPFPYEKLTDQPLIYTSMGTLQSKLIWVFQMIAEACVGLDVQLVIALGGGVDPNSFPELPGNTIVVGYAPQLELLQKATLTITHAGLNTTLESLSNGVPMIAIPITNDQPGVAARIAWTGTGELISLGKLKVEKLHKVIKKVLNENSYKRNALRLQEAIRQAGGVSRAADIVEQVVATEQPVLSRRLVNKNF